jgi:hypothetical protein
VPGVYRAAVTALLFLDVDGTLIPYDGSRLAEPAEVGTGLPDQANPNLGRINLALGPRLLALPAELMWATGWLHDANDVISPLLGLPQLPVVDLDEPQIDVAECYQLNSKTETLVAVAVAAGRPFIWIDDELTGTDRTWVAENHQVQRSCSGSTPTLDSLRPTSPRLSGGYVPIAASLAPHHPSGGHRNVRPKGPRSCRSAAARARGRRADHLPRQATGPARRADPLRALCRSARERTTSRSERRTVCGPTGLSKAAQARFCREERGRADLAPLCVKRSW